MKKSIIIILAMVIITFIGFGCTGNPELTEVKITASEIISSGTPVSFPANSLIINVEYPDTIDESSVNYKVMEYLPVWEKENPKYLIGPVSKVVKHPPAYKCKSSDWHFLILKKGEMFIGWQNS